MNIQTSLSARPLAVAQKAPRATTTSTDHAPVSDGYTASEPSNNLKGVFSRAVYGAALYGLPAVAGATMGINGLLPGAALGAGLGAITHLDSAKQAGIFAATGAVTGAAGAYIGFLGATVGLNMPAVLVAAAVGAGTQALFALTAEKG